MNWVTRTIVALAVAVGALLAGYLSYIWMQKPVTPADAAEVLLGTSLSDLRGERQAIGQWKGKVVVVNFWATWCPPCLKEIPEFVRLQDRLGPQGVQFVGIAIDDKSKVEAFAAEMGINYPLLIAETEGISLARQAGNRLGGLPFTVIIDRQGRTAKIELGSLDERKLVPILNLLM